MSSLLDETFYRITRFLELGPGEVKKGNKFGKELVESCEEIENLILDKEMKSNLRSILSKLNSYSSRLSRDVSNLEEGSLPRDWKRFAKQDFSRLKDEVLALEEFLLAHEMEIRKRLYEVKYGMNVKELFLRLTREEAIDEIVRSRLSKLVEDMEEEELREKFEENEERLRRISKWLFMLKEVKNA